MRPYWIDDGVEKVWIKASSLPAKTTRVFDVWKQGSETPSGDDTFDFFDDFDGTSLDASKWEYMFSSGNVSISDGIITLTGNNGSNAVAINTIDSFGSSVMVFNGNIKQTTAEYQINMVGYYGNWAENSFNAIYNYQTNAPNRFSVGDDSTVDSYTSIPSSYLDTYTVWEILRSGTSSTLKADGTNIITLSKDVTGNRNIALYVRDNDKPIEIDWIFVRKYAAVEPVVTVRDMGSFYRVYVYNGNTSTLVNFQFAVNTTDIGVTSASESLEISESPSDTALPYWAEGTDGRVFFKVPELKANATHQFVCMKDDGYEPNGSDVFELFSDFDGSFSDEWVGSGDYEFLGSNLSIPNFGGVLSVQQFSTLHAFEFKGSFNYNVAQSEIGFNNGIFCAYFNAGSEYNYQYQAINRDTSKITSFLGTSYTGTHIWSIIRQSNQNVYKIDGNTVATISTQFISDNAKVGINAWHDGTYGENILVDWAFVRKCALTEPTVTVEDKGSYYLITVTENSGSDLTDYQVYFDATDITLTSVSESLEITEVEYHASNYWIEATDGRTFVKIPELLPFETRMWAVYKKEGYEPSIFGVGKAGSDDFSADSIDTSIWDTANDNGNWSISSGNLVGSNSTGFWLTQLHDNGDNFTIWAKTKATDMDSSHIMTNVDVTTDPWSSGYAFRALANNNVLWLVKAGTQVAASQAISLTANSFYIVKISKSGTLLSFSIFNTSMNLLRTVTYTDASPLNGTHIAIRGYGETLTTDYILINQYASVEPTVTVEDMGTWYKVTITNNVGETLTDYQVAINSADLDIGSTTESLLILPVHRSETSNVPYADLFTDCVAYWDFMGDAQDVIGGANGTISGATLTTDQFGIQNAAYYFDGSNDYISFGNNFSNLINIKSGGSGGLVYWMKHYGGTTTNAHFNHFSMSTNDRFYIFLNTGTEGRIECSIGNGAQFDALPYTIIPKNEYHFIAVTWNNGASKLYIDGEYIRSGTYTPPASHGDELLEFGRVDHDNSRYAKTDISSAFIFKNIEPSAAHIKVLYDLTKFGYIYPIMHPRRLIM